MKNMTSQMKNVNESNALELTHREFAKADLKSVWQTWSRIEAWSDWDHGIIWSRLKKGHKFELGGEALLLPKGASTPLAIRLIECTPNRSFTDEAIFDLGSIQFSHLVVEDQGGVEITHSLKYVPIHFEAEKMFKVGMLPKLQRELPESVKALAKIVEQRCQMPLFTS